MSLNINTIRGGYMSTLGHAWLNMRKLLVLFFLSLFNACQVFLGWILGVLGIVGIFFGLLSIVDPVGAQLADDHNPFAAPPGVAESLSVIFMYVAIGAIGAWLILRKKSRPNPAIQTTRARACPRG
jgi:hypothetical protein